MTAISKKEFTNYVRKFQHKELFIELGWDYDRSAIRPLKIGEETVTPKIAADKNGFKIITVQTAEIPQYAARSKAAVALKKLFTENITIFTDNKRDQVWRYGKVEIKYNVGQDAERLYQRASGLIFEIDEQDNITIPDVIARVKTNFAANAERVTKKFYDAFRKEHTALLKLISGIKDKLDSEWYASIMLNRLMFCYFMQRRRFLDDDPNYLSNKLKESKRKLGKGKFYSFYRSFLTVLFQKGFGSREHSAQVTGMIGKIPYLNGGLFDLHEIERRNRGIDIPDKAFEQVFALFDRYEWHLDTRDCATGNEINPDVLGYIFEKYINDRAAMGAYYTQEDITNYISRSTILPYLLDSVKKSYPKPFDPNGAVWSFLKDSGDAYIFDSVKKGANLPLPENIAAGVDATKPDLLKRRKTWNTPAPAEYALPTEIWRETVERRQRYENTRALITQGKITEINDLITHNLDITNFTADLLDTVEDPKFISEFYKTLRKITVLDPTCGSGAFLFAALNILEPLYDSCLNRMDDYISHDYKGILDRNIKKSYAENLSLMKNELHPNKHYFIHKSIILNNLYGVDIMREAAETAKLRLFLKLVSTAEPKPHDDNYGIEPLPDIDFNIKAGNTLIGFANEKEVENALQGNLLGKNYLDATKEKMANLAKATERYKEIQLGDGDFDAKEFSDAKKDLTDRQNELKAILDKAMKSFDYEGVSAKDWENNYMPFHWVAEFYSIVGGAGGFDVVIGNPPYVSFSKIGYKIVDSLYACYDCKDLFALVLERGNALSKSNAKNGFIVPLSGFSVDGMESLRHYMVSESSVMHNSYFSASAQPSTLFSGVRHRLQIIIRTKSNGKRCSCYSTKFIKWFSIERDTLFSANIVYVNLRDKDSKKEKISSIVALNVLDKMNGEPIIGAHIKKNGVPLYYHDAPVSWHKVFSFVPYYNEAGNVKVSSHLKLIKFDTKNERNVAICLLNSTLFYWYNWQYSNCRDLSIKDVSNMRLSINELKKQIVDSLFELSVQLMKDLKKNSKIYKRNCNGVLTEFDSFYPAKSKPIIDQIDTLLSHHYGFTAEELDYIINYDIKYRMGLGAGVDAADADADADGE